MTPMTPKTPKAEEKKENKDEEKIEVKTEEITAALSSPVRHEIDKDSTLKSCLIILEANGHESQVAKLTTSLEKYLEAKARSDTADSIVSAYLDEKIKPTIDEAREKNPDFIAQLKKTETAKQEHEKTVRDCKNAEERKIAAENELQLLLQNEPRDKMGSEKEYKKYVATKDAAEHAVERTKEIYGTEKDKTIMANLKYLQSKDATDFFQRGLETEARLNLTMDSEIELKQAVADEARMKVQEASDNYAKEKNDVFRLALKTGQIRGSGSHLHLRRHLESILESSIPAEKKLLKLRELGKVSGFDAKRAPESEFDESQLLRVGLGSIDLREYKTERDTIIFYLQKLDKLNLSKEEAKPLFDAIKQAATCLAEKAAAINNMAEKNKAMGGNPGKMKIFFGSLFSDKYKAFEQSHRIVKIKVQDYKEAIDDIRSYFEAAKRTVVQKPRSDTHASSTGGIARGLFRETKSIRNALLPTKSTEPSPDIGAIENLLSIVQADIKSIHETGPLTPDQVKEILAALKNESSIISNVLRQENLESLHPDVYAKGTEILEQLKAKIVLFNPSLK